MTATCFETPVDRCFEAPGPVPGRLEFDDRIEHLFYNRRPKPPDVPPTATGSAVAPAYAELHCHTNFSFLDGASPADDLIARALELGLGGLAVTDHGGLYGVVRFASAAEEAGLRPIVGTEIELLDSAAPDPEGRTGPSRRRRRRIAPGEALVQHVAEDGRPERPQPERLRLPGHREPVKEDLRGVGERQRGPHLVLLARN